ncbi:MAG: flagellar hook-length control protein FliK [Granulosicoccus sp.]
MYDTGHAPLPGLKSMAAVLPGKTDTHNLVVSDNDSADGTFSTKLSAARERFDGGTKSSAFDDASRRQRPSDAPHTSADKVENTAGKSTHPDAVSKQSQQGLSATAVSEVTPEQKLSAAQAIKPQNGLETDVLNQLAGQHDSVPVTDGHKASATAAHLHASSIARDDAGQTAGAQGLLSSAHRGQGSDVEQLTGLLAGKDNSIPRDKNTARLQSIPDVGSGENLGQINADHASLIKAEDKTAGLVRGSLESDGAKAGVILVGLNPAKTLSGNTRLHSDSNPNGKTAANLTLIDNPVIAGSQLGQTNRLDASGNALPQQTAGSQLGQTNRLDASGNALPQQTAASLLADTDLPPALGNTSLEETVESTQELANLKRAALMNTGAEKKAVAMKAENAGHSIQPEGAKSGFNVEELLFQRSLAVPQTSGVNSDSGLHQSNSSVNMFHTFGSGILTAPVIARGLPEAGMMMTAPTTVSLLGENAGNDIAGNIRWMKSEGLKSAVINVSPSGMGPISVKIGIEDETMNVSFVALQGATRDALDSALPRLRDQLLSQGNESVRVDVSDGRTGQNRSDADGQLAENRQNQSNDDGSNGVETPRQIFGEQIPEVDELSTISSDNLPGEHSGKQAVRYDLYV